MTPSPALDLSAILLYVPAATLFTKVVVDAIRLAGEPPRWMFAVLSLVLGIVFTVLIMLALGVALTGSALAQASLAGVLAAGGAMGVTELSRRVAVADVRAEVRAFRDLSE